MSIRLYSKAPKEPLKNYFRSYFFACLIGNFIGIIATSSVVYYDKEVTKAKWVGALSGLGFSTFSFVWNIIPSFVSLSNRVGSIIAIVIWIIGAVFGIVYNYKDQKDNNL